MKSIFVSSTFKDMHAERDIIQRDVIPELSFFAESFGSELQFVDLRWGVNTTDLESEEGAKKVLSVCLDEIDSCKPYMIIILGERYGWRPNSDILKDSLKNRKFVLKDFDKSVTALEIEYGALSKFAKKENCLVFFRQNSFFSEMTQEELVDYKSEDISSFKKLSELKQKLKQDFGDNVIMYSPVWDEKQKKLTGFEYFSQIMIEKVKNMLQEEFESIKHLPWQEKERLETNTFIENKCRQFASGFEYINSYKQEILNPDTRLLLVRGNSGRGKSTLLCQLSKQLTEDKFNVFTFICGNSSRQATLADFYRQASYYIAKLLNESYENTNSNDLKSVFFNYINRYAAKNSKKLVLIIDAIDQLVHNKDIEDFGWLPPNIPKNITVVVSFLNSLETHLPKNLQNYVHLSQLNPLNNDEKLQIINGITQSNKKQLSSVVKLSIAAKENSKNALYISLLLQRLMLFNDDDFKQIRELGDGQEGIDEHMLNVINISPDNLHEMAAEILIEAGERINKQQSEIILPLLATSRFGLRALDIEKIVLDLTGAYSALDFSRLMRYMRPFFTLRDDARVNFTHKIIRQGLALRFKEKFAFFNDVITAHLITLKTSDNVREKELYYHAFVARDKQLVINCLATAKYFEEEQIREMCADIKALNTTDNGKWFCFVIKNCSNYNNHADFIYFIITHFFNAFSTSRRDLELLSSVAKAAYLHIYSQVKEYGLQNDIENLAKCLDVLSSTYLMRAQIVDYENNNIKAINYARKRIVVARYLNKHYPCEESSFIYARSLASIVETFQDSETDSENVYNYAATVLDISKRLLSKNSNIEYMKFYAKIQMLFTVILAVNDDAQEDEIEETIVEAASNTIRTYENILELEDSIDTRLALVKFFIDYKLYLKYMQKYREQSDYIYNNAKTFLHLKKYVGLEISFARDLDEENKYNQALVSYEKALTIIDYLETNFDETIEEHSAKSVIESIHELIAKHTMADKALGKIDKILNENKTVDIDKKTTPLLTKFYDFTVLRQKQRKLFVYIDKIVKRRKISYDNFATNRTLNNLIDIYTIKIDMLNKYKMSKEAWKFYNITINEFEDLYAKLTALHAKNNAEIAASKSDEYDIYEALTQQENKEVDENSALGNLTNYYYSGYKTLLANEEYEKAKEYHQKYFSLNSKVLESESLEDNIESLEKSYINGFRDYQQILNESLSKRSQYSTMRHPEGWHVAVDEGFDNLAQKIDELERNKEIDKKRAVKLKYDIIKAYGLIMNEAMYLAGIGGLESMILITKNLWKKTFDLCISIYKLTKDEKCFNKASAGINPVMVVAANYIFDIEELVKILKDMVLYCEPIKEIASTKIYCNTVYEHYENILSLYESGEKNEQKISEYKKYLSMLKNGVVPPLD